MSETAHLLELLYNAHRSFTTATGVLRAWHDLELSERAMRELQEREARGAGDGSACSVMIGFARAAADEPPPPRELVERTRFWLEKPDRFREEHSSDHPHGQDGLVAVRDGRRWWSYDPRWGAISNEHDPEVGSGAGQQVEQLLDPSDLLAGFELAILGESESAGRPALEVRATERPVEHHFFHRFPPQGDELRYLIDAERGVVLRKSVLLDGAEFTSTELLDLVFDRPIPPETFVLALPAGEGFSSPVSHRPLTGISVHEAAQRASFPVFVVPTLPEGQWRMMVTYLRPSERPPVQEAVHITYIRDDAQQHLTLVEGPPGDGVGERWGAYGEPETIVRGGNRYLVSRGEEGAFAPPTTVQFERDGTSIQMNSEDLELEVLLDLADQLAVA